MPLIVIESLSHSITPWRNVPMPSVTISEWMRKTVMKRPLMKPITTPSTRAASTAQPIGKPCLTLRTATSIDDSVMMKATERSKSPAVSGMMRPSVTTTRTACDPRIVEKLAQVRKVSGRSMPKTAMSRSRR